MNGSTEKRLTKERCVIVMMCSVLTVFLPWSKPHQICESLGNEDAGRFCFNQTEFLIQKFFATETSEEGQACRTMNG